MNEGKDYSIGHLRAKYLDMANMTFQGDDTTECSRNLDAFLDTIPDDSPAAGYIKEQFDRIELKNRVDMKRLLEEIKELGQLEKADIKTKGEQMLHTESLHDKKIVCWNALYLYKLNQEETIIDYKL